MCHLLQENINSSMFQLVILQDRNTCMHHSGQSWWRVQLWSHWCVFEVLRQPEPPQGGRVERCPGAMLRWVEREVSLHHRSLQETVEGDRSVGRTNPTLSFCLLTCLFWNHAITLDGDKQKHNLKTWTTMYQSGKVCVHCFWPLGHCAEEAARLVQHQQWVCWWAGCR